MADQTVTQLKSHADDEINCRDRTSVPEDLLSRFLAEEKPQFKVLRQVGGVRLWESRTQPFERHGFICSSQTRYHITERESLALCLMPDLDTAILNFVAHSNEVQHG